MTRSKRLQGVAIRAAEPKSAFRFPRPRPDSTRPTCSPRAGAQTGTRPEDHEEVCARTEVPPSGKKPRRVPAGKTDCGTPQRTSRTPLTPDIHHHPIYVDQPTRQQERGGQRSARNESLESTIRRARECTPQKKRKRTHLAVCRWSLDVSSVRGLNALSCPPTTQRVHVCVRSASSPTHFEPVR